MAARAAWKGTISLGLMSIFVEADKATDKYAGNEPISELCACHHAKLDRSHKCATTGQPPQSKVKGVEKPDGSYAILTPAQEESIKVSKADIEPLALVPTDELEGFTASELWYLKPQRKQEGSAPAVEGLYAWLADRKMALHARIVKDGKQHVIAIFTAKGVLCASRLRYSQELREPDGAALAVGHAEVNKQALEMFDTLTSELPHTFDISTVQDESVALKAAAVQAALSGGAVPTTEAAPTEPQSAVPDLMAQLKAAVDAKGGAPAKKKATTTKDKVKA